MILITPGLEVVYGLDDLIDLALVEFRKHGQRENLVAALFCDGQRVGMQPFAAVGLLEVDWHGVVNQGLHSLRFQPMTQLVAVPRANNV